MPALTDPGSIDAGSIDAGATDVCWIDNEDRLRRGALVGDPHRVPELGAVHDPGGLRPV